MHFTVVKNNNNDNALYLSLMSCSSGTVPYLLERLSTFWLCNFFIFKRQWVRS